MTEIFCVAVAVLGFVLGIGVEAFLDNRTIKDISDENRALRRAVHLLKNEIKKAGRKEIIEIVDNRIPDSEKNYFRPF